VFLQVKQKDGACVLSDIVSSGQEFTFNGQDSKGTLGSSIKVYSNGSLAAEFHTSCSEPIGAGVSDGAFTVIAGKSRNGGELCAVDGSAVSGGSDDGDDEDGDSKKSSKAKKSPKSKKDDDDDDDKLKKSSKSKKDDDDDKSKKSSKKKKGKRGRRG